VDISCVTHGKNMNLSVVFDRLSSTCINSPFPSCPKHPFQSEAKYEAIVMKMISYSHVNKTHFHKTGFALSLVLKTRYFVTRKWSILSVFRCGG